MPLRAFGYVASAAHIASRYFPEAQVQMVHTINTGARINGVLPEAARRAATTYANLGDFLLGSIGLRPRQITHLVDPSQPANIDEIVVSHVLETALPPD